MFPARSLNAWLRTLGLVAVALCLLLLAFGALAASPALAQDAAPDQPVAPAIVGGRDADPGAWPWQVALLDRFGAGNPRGFFCGG